MLGFFVWLVVFSFFFLLRDANAIVTYTKEVKLAGP